MSKQPFFLDHEHHPPFAFFPGISEFRVPGLSSSRAPCQCPPPRSTAGVPPPCLPTGEITTLAPQGRRGRSQSPPWFRLAPSWAYRFLSDRPSPILAARDALQGSTWTEGLRPSRGTWEWVASPWDALALILSNSSQPAGNRI